MAQESFYVRFFWLAVTAILAWTGVAMSFGMTMRTDMSVIRVQMDAMQAGITKMELSLIDGTRNRYTSDNAAQDRATVNRQIDANTEWNRKQDEELKQLAVWRAAVQAKIDAR